MNCKSHFFHSSIHIEKKEHGHGKVSVCAQVHDYPVDIQDLFIGQEVRFDCKDNYNSHIVSLDLQTQVEQMRVNIGAAHQEAFRFHYDDLVCWFVPSFVFFFFCGGWGQESENQRILSWLESGTQL